jgi:hypothetical protein
MDKFAFFATEYLKTSAVVPLAGGLAGSLVGAGLGATTGALVGNDARSTALGGIGGAMLGAGGGAMLARKYVSPHVELFEKQLQQLMPPASSPMAHHELPEVPPRG